MTDPSNPLSYGANDPDNPLNMDKVNQLALGPLYVPRDPLSVGAAGSGSPAENFWDAFDSAYAKSKLGDSSHVHLFQHGPDEMEINHIQVDPDQRGKGIGNKIMDMLTGLADEHGVTLHASPASDADPEAGMSTGALREWYGRWGFDPSGSGDRMTRPPTSSDDQ